MEDITFSIVLQELRNKSGLSRKKFSEKIGQNEHTFRGWELGKHLPLPSTRSAILRTAQKLVRSLSSELPEDMEILSTEDAQRLFSDINDGIDGNRADVPFGVLMEALNRHCPPTQYIKIMDDIRGKYV